MPVESKSQRAIRQPHSRRSRATLQLGGTSSAPARDDGRHSLPTPRSLKSEYTILARPDGSSDEPKTKLPSEPNWSFVFNKSLKTKAKFSPAVDMVQPASVLAISGPISGQCYGMLQNVTQTGLLLRARAGPPQQATKNDGLPQNLVAEVCDAHAHNCSARLGIGFLRPDAVHPAIVSCYARIVAHEHAVVGLER